MSEDVDTHMIESVLDECSDEQRGFAAAMRKEPRTSNPNQMSTFDSKHHAWNHGWDTYQSGEFPFGVVRLFILKAQPAVILESERIFWASKELPEWMEELLIDLK